jgi:ATP-binding cassette subfamily F protein uup
MTPLLQASHLTQRFGERLLYQDLSFSLPQGQKTALIAPNGAGKTTLLRLLSGRDTPQEGLITCPPHLRIGYLPQTPSFPPGLTTLQACLLTPNPTTELIHTYQAALDADDTQALQQLLPRMEQEKAWLYEQKAKQILTQLNIRDPLQKTETLSGGQLKRLALAATLLPEPDLLLLDEPTNHLDLPMIEWLQEQLTRPGITLLMVTHDRYFLDAVCTQILEIDRQQLYTHNGNYTYYLSQRTKRLQSLQTTLTHATNLLRKELDWMQRQPQARATKAKYRIDAFHRLQKETQQATVAQTLTLPVNTSYIGNQIFQAQHVSKRFGDIKITHDFDYIFARYEKLGIIGDNGTGKSTFIKMLLGQVAPDSGHFTIGSTVRFGYYSQEEPLFDHQLKVIDALRHIAEQITLSNGKTLTASQFLTHFLFPPDKQHDFIGKLSGGERRRLYLCTILLRNPNFLILDEPTNDLDIPTLNILEEYLTDFKGCLILISHDRYFMDKIVDHLFIFHGHASIQDFPGNYTQYRLWKAQQDKAPAHPTLSSHKTGHRSPPDKKKPTYKEQKELQALELEIPALEAEKQTLETSLSSGTLTVDELNTHSARIGVLIDLIDEKTLRWLELSE